MRDLLMAAVGFLVGAISVGSFAFWFGVRFGVVIVAEQYKRVIQSNFPASD